MTEQPRGNRGGSGRRKRKTVQGEGAGGAGGSRREQEEPGGAGGAGGSRGQIGLGMEGV